MNKKKNKFCLGDSQVLNSKFMLQSRKNTKTILSAVIFIFIIIEKKYHQHYTNSFFVKIAKRQKSGLHPKS